MVRGRLGELLDRYGPRVILVVSVAMILFILFFIFYRCGTIFREGAEYDCAVGTGWILVLLVFVVTGVYGVYCVVRAGKGGDACGARVGLSPRVQCR
jgi:hypothetical protein